MVSVYHTIRLINKTGFEFWFSLRKNLLLLASALRTDITVVGPVSWHYRRCLCTLGALHIAFRLIS